MASGAPSGNNGNAQQMWTNVDPFAEDAGGDDSSRGTSNEHDEKTDKDEDVKAPVDTLAPDDRAGVRFASSSHSGNVGSTALVSTDSSSSDPKDENFIDRLRTRADDVGEGIVEKVRTAAHKFHLDGVKATGPSRLFNPTNIRMHVKLSDDDPEATRKELAVLWRSRDNRKGRKSIAVPLQPTVSTPDPSHPRLTSHWGEVFKNFKRMAITFPYWDMAFWGGWSYTFGSILFTMSGAFAFAPIANPSSTFPNEDTYATDFCFIFGAILYQVGAVVAYLEAVNDGSFHGSAMRRLLVGHDEDEKKLFDDKIHHFFGHLVPHFHHHHGNPDEEAGFVDTYAGWNTKHRRSLRPGSIYPDGKSPVPRRGALDLGEDEGGKASTYATWRWWPSYETLKTHHVYEIGYIACTIQLFGVTLFGVTAIVVWPETFTTMARWQELGAYWVPQIVASLCFLVASFMFMFETQQKWWKPELGVMGWWIGAWSIVGSVGFELCAIFGTIALYYEDATWCSYQSELSSTWGSAAYAVGSFLQWYEALNKNPVEEILNEPGAMKSWQIHPL